MEDNGVFFGDKVYMGNFSSHERGNRQRKGSNVHIIPHKFSNHYMYYLFATIKEDIKLDMASVKLGWILFHLLGWPTLIFAYISDIAFQPHMEQPYKTIINIFAIIFILINCFRAYEKYRNEKLHNDEREFDFTNKKNNHNKK